MYYYYNCCQKDSLTALKQIDITELRDDILFEGFSKACENGHFRIVRYLVNNEYFNTRDGCQRLYDMGYRWTWCYGHKAISKYLINKGNFYPEDKFNNLLAL